MEYKVCLIKQAEFDIDNAFFWYETQQPKLGEKFIRYIDKGFQFIAKYPKASQQRIKSVRCHIISKFPFGIYYKIDELNKEIQIIAVLHFKRNPKLLDLRK